MDLRFHVIFTPGTVAQLRPFVLSLVARSASVRVHLVANGCRPPEVALLERLAGEHPRLAASRFPAKQMAEHGTALDALLEHESSEWFAFLDSDVFAVGDFVAELRGDIEAGRAVFAGVPIWATAADQVAPDDARVLAGPQNRTAGGVCLGTSYFAVYPRRRLQQAMGEFGVTFEKILSREDVPPAAREVLAGTGIAAEHFETGKLLNILLDRSGQAMCVRDLASIRHVGGLSLLAKKKEKDRAWLPAGADDEAAPKWASNPDRPWMPRKHVVCGFVSECVRELQFGREPPASVEVAEVDVRARVLETRGRLVELYRGAARGEIDRLTADNPLRGAARAWWNVRRAVLPSARPISTLGYFVLGMHRSGTSCLTGLLEAVGLYVGSVARTAKHNARGNLEDENVRAVNKDLLQQFGGTWDVPPPDMPVEAIDPRPLRAALEPFRRHPRWAVKDPRVLLVLDAWLRHAPNHRLVGTFRHPTSVAGSLLRRNRMALEDGVSLWCRYTRELVDHHRRAPFPLISFDLEGDAYLDAFARLCPRLDLPHDANSAREAYAADLVSQHVEALGAPGELGGEAGELYAYLLEHQV